MIEQIATSSNFQSTLQQTQQTSQALTTPQTNSANKSTKAALASSNIPPASSSPFSYNLTNYLGQPQTQSQHQALGSASKQASAKEQTAEQHFQQHQHQNPRYPSQAQNQNQPQFAQPSFSTFDQNNWQAAYSKYPLTFLPTPPQFSQQSSGTSVTTTNNSNNGSPAFPQKSQPIASQQNHVCFIFYLNIKLLERKNEYAYLSNNNNNSNNLQTKRKCKYNHATHRHPSHPKHLVSTNKGIILECLK